MRILLFIGSLHTGGSQMQLSALARGLRDLEQDVHVATIFPGGRFWKDLSNEPGLTIHSLFPRRPNHRFGVGAALMTAYRPLARLASRLNADALYSMLDVPNFIALLARNRAKVPLVWGLRSGRNRMPFYVATIRRLCMWMSKSVPLVIANSHSGLRHHESLGLSAGSHVVIDNGVDTGHFYIDEDAGCAQRRDWGIPSDAPLVGLVGRLSPIKDHETFLAAAAIAVRRRQELRFVIVGGGKRATAESLERSIARRGLAESVSLVSETTRMRDVYNALDLLALSSIGEGFPNVLLEGMACGLPCVSTRAGEADRIIGSADILVPIGDPDALASAMLRRLQSFDGDKSRQRRHVEERFGIEAMAQRTLAHLQDVARTGSGERRTT